MKVGGSLTELHKATCFEKLEGAAGEKQVSFNQSLVTSAGGHLAELSGQEQFCSVGCGGNTSQSEF